MSKRNRPPEADPDVSSQAGHSPSSAQLRSRGERKTRKLEQLDWDGLSPEAARRAMQELQVHQVELEMQNEELRRVQGELEASRARYFDLYDLAPVGYIMLSSNGLILEGNLTAANLLGSPRGALAKRRLTQFILPEDQDVFYLHLGALWRTAAPQSFELQLMRSGKDPFWARLDAILDGSGQGGDSGVVRITLSDISERKRAEELDRQLEQQRHQVLKAESLGRFAGAIAHHFNNKLMAVMGNLEMALDELRPGEESALLVREAREAALEAAEISNLMLAYLGQTLAEFSSVDLVEECREFLEHQRSSLPEQIALEAEIPSCGLIVWANRMQVHQTLRCLISNAREAIGDREGTIRVSLSVVQASTIDARRCHPIDWKAVTDRYTCLEVHDTGCGIASDQIDSIFDPFYTTKFNGRGLGLPVLLGTVREHRGVITVESQAGQGATFRVFFPLEAQKVDLNGREAESDRGPIGDLGLVLCVDDDQVVLKVSEAMLKKLDCEVLTARDGTQAVELFQEHRDAIRFVLLDLIMPGMDGWQTLAELRAIRPDIPVILVSGYDEAYALHGEHPVKPQGFIHKPYGKMELRKVIEEALKASSKPIMS